MHKRVLLALTMAFAVLLNGCEHREAQLPVPVEQLAQTIHLSIAGKTLRLPLVSLLSITGASQIYRPYGPAGGSANAAEAIPVSDLLSSSGDVGSPHAEAVYANIQLQDFGTLKDARADQYVGTLGLCPLLKQQWASALCNGGLLDGEHAFYPNRFTLIDEAYLQEYKLSLGYYAGAGSIGDAARQMAPYTAEPQARCDVDAAGQASQLCTVVMRVEKRLLAVWSTNRGASDRDALAMDAKSVRLFIENATGETEDYERLKSGLNRLHRRVHQQELRRNGVRIDG